MKRVLIVMLGLVMVAVLGVQAAGSGDDTRLVLKWKTMAGVVPPYTGTANPIREVNGGGLPWSIRRPKECCARTGSSELSSRA